MASVDERIDAARSTTDPRVPQGASNPSTRPLPRHARSRRPPLSPFSATTRTLGSRWSSALEENRADLLDENFTGGARQQWQDAIHAQQQNGLSRRIVDHGHQVRVRFYSLDGSALEAIDAADLEIEYREGGKLLSSERIQARYLVLLTPAENSWKIRILQEVPPS